MANENDIDPGTDYLKRVVIKMRKDKSIFIKIDPPDGLDVVTAPDIKRIYLHLISKFNGYAGEAKRTNARKAKEQEIQLIK
jgi:hypothetical protein